METELSLEILNVLEDDKGFGLHLEIQKRVVETEEGEKKTQYRANYYRETGAIHEESQTPYKSKMSYPHHWLIIAKLYEKAYLIVEKDKINEQTP